MEGSKVEFTEVKFMIDGLHQHLVAAAEILKKFNRLMGGDFEIVANISFEKVSKKKPKMMADVVDVWEREDSKKTPKDERPDCHICEGTGFDPTPSINGLPCPHCKGEGFVEE